MKVMQKRLNQTIVSNSLYNTERELHLLRISCLRNVRCVQISGRLPWDN